MIEIELEVEGYPFFLFLFTAFALLLPTSYYATRKTTYLHTLPTYKSTFNNSLATVLNTTYSLPALRLSTYVCLQRYINTEFSLSHCTKRVWCVTAVNEFSGGNRVSALLEGSDFCGCRGCCAVDKESLKMVRDGDRREEFPRGIYSSRWAVHWVVLTGDKSCMGRDEIGGAFDQKGMDALEHIVNEFVPVSAHFPAFDDAGVVAIDSDML